MAKLDFPTNPSPGATYVATNGVTYEWDNSIGIGVWTAVTSTPFAIASAGLISGSPQVGSTLTYTPGTYIGGKPPVAESWIWKKAADGSTLQANGLTFVITSLLVGERVYVEYTATDASPTTLTANTNNFPTSPATITTAGFPSSVWAPTPAGAMTAGYPGTSSGTWNGGNGATITATGCVEVSNNGTSYGPTTTISNGQTLYQRWSASGTCGGSASGTPLTGTVSNGTYTSTYNITLDRVPAPIADISDSNVPLSSTITKATASGISGINATAYVTYVNTSTGTSIQAATAPGGPFTTLATSGTTFPVNNGQTLYIRQTVGSGTTVGYTAIIRVGDGTNTAGTYDEFTYTATTVSSASFPGIPTSLQNGPTTSDGTASGVWASGATTLTSTGCLLISTNNSTFNQGPLSILDGQTLYEQWDTSPACGGANSGQNITGTLTNTTYTQSYSLTLDRTPAAITFTGATNVPLSSVQTSNVVTLSGTNAPAFLTYDASSTGDNTTYFAIINSGTPVAIPAAPSTACPVPPGATLAVRQTAGSTASNTRNLVVKLGNSDGTASVSATYAVTTTSSPVFVNTVFTPTTGPNASPSTTNLSTPSLFGTASTTNWADGITSISTTGDLLFRIPPAVFGQTAVTVNPGNTVELAWDSAAAIAAATGTGTLTGTLTNGTNINSYTLTVDKVSDTYAWTDLTTQTLGATVQSNIISLAGFNCPAHLTCTPDPTNPLLSIKASINGGAFTTIPTTGTGLLVNPANGAGTTATTIQLEATLGSTSSTAYKVTTELGFGATVVTDEWSVTTTAVLPTVSQPSIINPTGSSVSLAATWTSQTSGTANSLRAVTYGNSQYVAIGDSGTIITSPNGTTWTGQTSGTATSLSDVTYGNSLYAAVGGSGIILTSSNGTAWTSQTSGTAQGVNGITYGNSQYVAVGGGGTILTSPDGTTWTGQTGGGTNFLTKVTYGGGQYIAVGTNSGSTAGAILTSPNGTTWTSQTSGTANLLRNVIYANSLYVAVGNTGTILTSPNGTTWTTQTSGTTQTLFGVTYANSQYVVVGDTGTILVSTNGTTWTSQTSGTTFSLNGVTYGNAQLVAVGDAGKIFTSAGATVTLQGDPYVGNNSPGAHTSSDWQLLQMGATGVNPTTAAINTVTQNAVAWTSQTSGTSTALFGITYGGQYVTVGSSGIILTSPNGTTWTSQTSGTAVDLRGVGYGNGLYVAVGEGASGTILTSSNGTTWTSRASGTTNGLYGVTYGNSLYVAVGFSGTIRTSPDGTTWSSQSGGSGFLRSVTYAGGQFVTVGNGGKIITSPDGTTWTTQTSGTSNNLLGVTYANSLYVAVGGTTGTGIILTSPNGITWTSQTSGATTPLEAVTYANSQFVAVGFSGTVRTSSDGITWTNIDGGGSNNGVVYGNDQFVICTQAGGIYTSGGVATTTLTLAAANGLANMVVGDTLVEVGGGADATGTITAINAGIPSVTVAPGSTNWTTTATATDTSRTVSTTDTVLLSTNAITATGTTAASWTSQTSGTANTLQSVTYGNSLYVATGQSGTILTSSNGTSWTAQTSGTANLLFGVTYGNSLYVAVGTSGTVLTSPNGTTWTSQTSGAFAGINAVTYGNSLYVTAGDGDILTSPDGTNWTSRYFSSGESLLGAVYGGGQYVVVGINSSSTAGTILTSPNGTTWTGQTSNTTQQLNGIAYGNSLYVAVGTGGAIVTSPNGTTWTAQTSGTAQRLNSVAYQNSLFVAAGNNGTILTSSNGTTWTSQTSGSATNLNGATFGNSQFAVVGNGGTILTSVGSAVSNLTITGADTDGFIVGNLISNGLTTTPAFGTITAVNGTTVSVAPSSANWAGGQNLYRGKTILNADDDLTNLTTYPVPGSNFVSATTYNTRVRYNSVSNPPIYTSPWSAWASFGTA